MRSIGISYLFLTLLIGGPAVADPLGEHPAVTVQRLYAKQGYDYASKFYPHPAWLWFYTEAGVGPEFAEGTAGHTLAGMTERYPREKDVSQIEGPSFGQIRQKRSK